MAVYAIGDVQGCLEPLQRLLDKLRFDPAADHLWFCGDLVNRGGQSLEVLRLIKSLDIHSHVVLGNHDLSLLAISMRREDEQRKVNAELQRVLFAEDREELLDWLRKRPLMHVDAARGWAMVHAGLAPKWTVRLARQRAHEVELRLHSPDYRKLLRGMFGNQPDTWSPKLNGVDRMRAIINVFTRMRFAVRRAVSRSMPRVAPEPRSRVCIPGLTYRATPSVNCASSAGIGLRLDSA